jgi:hypothetical protein
MGDDNSRLLYSTNPTVAIAAFLEAKNGDVDAVLLALFDGSCSYESARQMSVIFSGPLDLTEIEFMKKWRIWRQKKRF